MIFKSIFVLLFYCYLGARRAQAKGFILENSSPAIRGANVTFTVTVTNHTEELLKYLFYDGTGISKIILTREQSFNHTVECKKAKYDAGSHGFGLHIFRSGKYHYTWDLLDSAYTNFTLTETLNGGPKMIQRGEYLSTDYVYPYEPVYHYLEIPHEEHMLLEQEPTERLYYWYINCTLVEVTRDFCILHTYTDAQETYDLRVVLVVKKKLSTSTMHPGLTYHKPGSLTSPRPRPTTTERYNGWYNRGTSERTSRRHYNWDDDQSNGTSPRPRLTTTARYNGWYNRGTSERTSRRHYNWDDDQSNGTSPKPRPTTTERYNGWYNRGTSERTTHRYYKRDVYNGHYNKRRFDNDQCMPDIDDDVFAYGVYQQTIHIIDRNNPPTTNSTTSTKSTTTSEPLIIIDPKWPTTTESPIHPTTDKDQKTGVSNSIITGNLAPFSISTILSQNEFPKNIHIRGILNMILKGTFNFEYSET